MDSPTRGSAQKNPIETFLHFLSILMEFRWLIIIATGAVALATLAYLVVSVKLPPEKSPMPNTYTAQGIILINPSTNNDTLSRAIMQALGSGYIPTETDTFDYGAMVQVILTSNVIIDQAVDDFHLADKYRITGFGVKARCRKLVLANLKLEYTRVTGALNISYTDIDPTFAASMVNKLMDLLDQWFNLNQGAVKQKQKKMLETSMDKVKSDIATIQDQIKSLQKKYGFIQLSDLSNSQTATLETLRQRIVDKEIEIRNYAAISKVDDARLAQLKQERLDLIELLNEKQASFAESSRIEGDSTSAADVAQLFNQLQEALGVQQTVLNTLSGQYEAAKLTPDAQPIFQILQSAEPPDDKSGPKRSKLFLVAVAGAFAASIAAALLINWLRSFIAQLRRERRI